MVTMKSIQGHLDQCYYYERRNSKSCDVQLSCYLIVSMCFEDHVLLQEFNELPKNFKEFRL